MDRVTRAAAARELGLNKATVTRWVQKHPALLDELGHVSIEDLRQHRDTVINVKLQTRGPSLVAMAPSREPRLAPEAPVPTMNSHRVRTEAAKAETAELDLADRLGQTLWRKDVEAAVVQAADILQQKAGQLVRERAEGLVKINDVRAMERALDDLMRELLDAGAKALAVAAEDAALARAG